MNKSDLENLQSYIDVWESEQADYVMSMYVYKKDIKTFKTIVDKNTPNKISKNKYGVGFCPKCKSSVWQNRDESNYCFRCGQRIEWI